MVGRSSATEQLAWRWVLNCRRISADAEDMKLKYYVLLLAMVMAACSTATSTPTTFGVDGAPQLLKNTFLTVTRQAATLAGYDATNDQWMEFAREVCDSGFESSEDLSDFVSEKAGAKANQDIRQMWSTAAKAATSAFCPIGGQA